jgi:muconate cycloisomerase
MEITEIEVIPYRIPNQEEHQIASLTLSALENVIVVIRTDDGTEGIGEAVSVPKWNSNVLEAQAELLRSYLAPSLIGKDPTNIAEIWKTMDGVINGHYAAKAAIDVAVHDLVCRKLGIPVWKYLGGAYRRSITVEGPGFGIGFMEPEDAAAFALKAVDRGCKEIELKCGHPSGWEYDLEVLETVHEACGPDVELKVDITEGYDYKTAMKVLPKMADFGVMLVEQPLPRQQLDNLARLRENVPVHIILDESVGYPNDILEIANRGAADAIHLKYPMLGGFTMCRKIAAICEAEGLGIQGGTSTPSGVGLRAVHQFTATLPEVIRGCHGSPLARAVDDIVVNPVDAYASSISISDEPGLGVELDEAKVEQYRAEQMTTVT